MGLLKKIFGKGGRASPSQEHQSQVSRRSYTHGELICDEYIVQVLLGQGGMGEVYLVEHLETGNLRAAKIMRVSSTVKVADLVGFRQEARALLNIGTHPFVTRLFDVREQGRDIVLIMDYVAPVSGCTTVEDYITRTQDYGDDEIGMWAVQFCVGMEHALGSGVAAHRDIKPGNLLIDSGVFLKIADFGIALAVSQYPKIDNDLPKRPSQLQWLEIEKGRITCGTPGYIAPELFAGGNASPQSDMFSFGVTLWQLAARSMTPPYQVNFNGDPIEYQRAILAKVHTHAVRSIESPYFDVISRCLMPDPGHRYPDFSSLREAIKSAAKAANIQTTDYIVAPGFSGNFEDYVNRGLAYIVLERYERAQRILDEAVKLKPDSSMALVAQAEALVHRGQLVPAIRAYEAAHRISPQIDSPLTGMALAWLELGNPMQARSALDQVLSRHPANLEARLLHARVVAEEGNTEAALNEIEEVIATNPQVWRAYDYKGRALLQMKNFVDAKKSFSTCLRINPLALNARLAMASLLTKQNAEAVYEHGIQLYRENPEQLNKIATHMAEGGHAVKAIQLFQELAEAVPETRSIMLVNIGNAQLKLGNARSAINSYQQAIKTDPTNALAYNRLGDIENDNDRIEKAADLFARACELDPQNSTYHASAGTAYMQLEDYNRAIMHLRYSVKVFAEQPHILYNLAAALVSSGQTEAAIEELAEAVRIDRGYARGWYLKAQVEAHLGRTADAAASAAQAVTNASSLSDQELEGVRALLG